MKYHKIIITFLLALNLIPCIKSMAGDPQKERIGIRGGVNFANFYNSDNSTKSSNTTGFNLGMFCKMAINEGIALQPELYYTRKGSEQTYNNVFANGTARYNLNYIEMPILLVLNITKNFNLHAGPYAAFLVSGKTSNESNVTLFNFEDNIKTEDYNRFDGGFVLGAGIDVNAMSFGARYNYGLTKVGKEKTFAGYTYTYPDATNGVISMYLSLSLN